MRLHAVAPMLAFASGLSLIVLATWGFPVSVPIPPESIQPSRLDEGPHAYSVTVRRGLLQIPGDTMQTPQRSALVLFEDGVRLGPAHTEHVVIAARGQGRFSHWQTNLVFSSSDGTDPRVNGRTYRYEAVRYAPPWSGWAGVALIGLAVALARRRLAGMAVALAPLRGVAVSVGLTAGLVLVVFAAGELWFRLTTPFVASEFHIRFDPEFGFHFEPHSRVRATNHLDYWTEQEANALGLLDRPPREARALAGQCRIAVIGDSFVEAVQVPIDAKVHVVLETMARQAPVPMPIATAAFGYSGTGQLNQLAYYERFVRAFAPHVVVLVFVANDFANNSAVLEAIRHGWDPEHAPFVYAEAGEGGTLHLTAIDPDWRLHLLPRTVAGSAPVAATAQSLFWRWIRLKLALLMPRADAVDPLLAERGAALAARPRYRSLFEDWQPTTIAKLDGEDVWQDRLPRVLDDAMTYTAFALDEFKRRADRDNAALVILATHSMRRHGEALFARLGAMAASRGIAVVDQTAHIHAAGGTAEEAGFPHDAHWNGRGHTWAAEALLQHLVGHPELCAPRQR